VKKTDTADRQNTAGEQITGKKAGLDYRMEKIMSLVYVL
jgi:hypothetical protein